MSAGPGCAEACGRAFACGAEPGGKNEFIHRLCPKVLLWPRSHIRQTKPLHNWHRKCANIRRRRSPAKISRHGPESVSMKPAWIVACALPLLVSFPSYPQQASSPGEPDTSSESSAATAPGIQDVFAAPVANEDELRQGLVGKQLYLRGLWLGDDLHFSLHGDLASQSPKGSFTLCEMEIERVRMTKKKVELDGVRYGIHFEDEGNWGEQAASFDRIRVTPKKKHLTITIDRQQVIVPKKKKQSSQKAGAVSEPGNPQAAATEPVAGVGVSETTQDPAKAAAVLEQAMNKIFAPALDGQMIAQMPDYWRYFYQAQMDHKSIEPTDPNIVRPGPGVEGPKLEKNLVAASNDYAQKSQVAGVAIYKVILGTDGKPMAVAVFRPIGFGLDENAVTAIEKSQFSPAMKGGKATASVVDVDVTFRIYSKRTSQAPGPEAMQEAVDAEANVSPVTGRASLPGLFSVEAGAANQ